MVHTPEAVSYNVYQAGLRQTAGQENNFLHHKVEQTNLAITTSQLLVWQTQAYIHSQHKNMYNITGTCKQLRAYFTSYYMHTNENIDA